MRCPLCETESSDDAAECGSCGRQLHSDAQIIEEVRPLEGLEETLRDPLESGTDVVERLAGLEQTQVARRDLRIEEERVPGVEYTQLAADAAAPVNWTAGSVELDPGREQDLEPRTQVPQDIGLCPWCGAEGQGAVCDECGHRRALYTGRPAASAARSSGETVLCPACFSRVPEGERCEECGVPFAPREP